MKGVGSKTMSSPSRGGAAAAENYPPPLIMRFLRSNVGSKSRGARSRSSPLFVIRKRNAAAAAAAATMETQEPSSPKVTCMGQVRVGRSKKPGQLKHSQGTCTCFSLTKCSLCTPRKPKLRKWASFFGCCKKVDVVVNEDEEAAIERDEEAAIERKEDSEEVLRVTTPPPPKNALLLTRCRSAPFRSSSLAVQFWGEANNDIGDDEVKITSCRRNFHQRQSSQSEKQMSTKLRFDEEESGQICATGKQLAEGGSGVGKNMEQVDMPHPLVLMRCSSESASKTGEKQAK